MKVGIEKISAMANRFGLGFRHDLPLSSVNTGLMPTKDWKRSARGAEWVVGDTVNASIGQGFMLASPLQLAVMATRIAGRSNDASDATEAVMLTQAKQGHGALGDWQKIDAGDTVEATLATVKSLLNLL